MNEDFEENKDNFYPNNKKNTILFILTFICILFFIILMLRSYQIYNKQNNLDSLEAILSKDENIKEKVDDLNHNYEIDNLNSSYYDEINQQNNNIEDIILNSNNNAINKQEKTINDLLDENINNTFVVENTSTELDNMINNIQNNYDISNNGFIVQLVSLKNENYAEQYMDNIKKNYPEIVQNLNGYINKIDNNGQIYYRVQFETFNTKNDAKLFCKKLQENAKIQSCIILKK